MLRYFLFNHKLTWGQQFKAAVMLGPTIDEDDMIDDVTCGEAFMHFLTVPWKVLFAFIPPPHYGGGWPAFFIALGFIGCIVWVVSEVAFMLGCFIHLKPAVNGFTIVALGTSLPDLFASQIAARNSKYADSAIGNITGSNSVNVFLGLGIPWFIASIYWYVEHDKSSYHVPKGSLIFSVIIFLATSVVCFFILAIRRCCVGGEIGGPAGSRYSTAAMCLCLWFTYIILCALQAYDIIKVDIKI